MKDLWLLSIQTSLPNTCSNHEDLKKTFLVYDSFEKARTALQQELHKLAFSNNSMFDGAGRMKMLKQYLSGFEDINEDEFGETFLGQTVWYKIQDILVSIFNAEKVRSKLDCGKYDDSFIELTVESDSFFTCGIDDGPCNGINPILSTNMFAIDKEHDYYLYIDDTFGQDECSSELYVDLKRVELK